MQFDNTPEEICAFYPPPNAANSVLIVQRRYPPRRHTPPSFSSSSCGVCLAPRRWRYAAAPRKHRNTKVRLTLMTTRVASAFTTTPGLMFILRCMTRRRFRGAATLPPDQRCVVKRGARRYFVLLFTRPADLIASVPPSCGACPLLLIRAATYGCADVADAAAFDTRRRRQPTSHHVHAPVAPADARRCACSISAG